MSESLLSVDGRPLYGVFGGEIEELNMGAYNALSSLAKKVRAKRWRFVGVFHPEIVAGIAVVDMGYIASTFAYAFDIKTCEIVEFRAVNPLGVGCCISDNSKVGEATFKHGKNRVEIQWGLDNGAGKVDVSTTTPNGPLEIQINTDEAYSSATPHQVTFKTPGGRFAYTHKSAGYTASGRIRYGDKTIELTSADTFSAVDHTVGYHDYNWGWRWASLSGFSKDGRRVGLNLVEPIHHDVFQENALWIDGERIPLGRAIFNYNRDSILEPWEVATESGVIRLLFNPLGERAETLNVGLIKSCFHQPVGLYSGEILTPNGEKLELENVPGVVEDHEARW